MIRNPLTINVDKGFLPDLVPFAMPQGALTKAENLLPYDEGYFPAKNKLTYSSSAMSGTPLAGMEFKADDGTAYLFCGSTTKLYRLETNKSLTDITKVATSYTATSDRWYFEKYGTWIIATNYADAPQVLKGLTAANYADLGGSPPKAKYLLLNNGHLIFGYLNEAGTVNPRKLLWSAFESLEDYTDDLTTGANSQVLADADGFITGMAPVGSAFGVFHENSITMGYYTGAPYTFNLLTNKVKKVGAIPGTIISIGPVAFFIGYDDIYYFDGNIETSIGFGIKAYILSTLNITYLHRISTAHDAQRGIIFWSYPSTASPDGTPDKILCYNYRQKRFTIIDIDCECIFSLSTGARDIDSIDSEFPSLDAIPYPIDSNFWIANSKILACADNDDSKVATFDGTSLTATLETREIGSDDISQITNVRPKIQNAVDDVSIRIGSRMNENDGVSYSDSTTVGSNGYANLRRTGRLLRVELTTQLQSGITDIDIDIKRVGGR